MKTFVSFIIKEAKHILRDKRTMLILFGMPVVLMLLFGFAITNDVRNVRTVVVTSSMDYQTQKAIERLKASEYFNITGTAPSATEAERMIRNQQADMAVVFTQQFAKGQVEMFHFKIQKGSPMAAKAASHMSRNQMIAAHSARYATRFPRNVYASSLHSSIIAPLVTLEFTAVCCQIDPILL